MSVTETVAESEVTVTVFGFTRGEVGEILLLAGVADAGTVPLFTVSRIADQAYVRVASSTPFPTTVQDCDYR